MGDTITINKNSIIKWLLIIGILIISGLCVYISYNSNKRLKNIEEIQEQKNKYTKIYYDGNISDLKKKNKELYDSLKKYKDVETATQFHYHKEYKPDTVFITSKQIINKEKNIINSYIYKGGTKKDSLYYNLTIGSTVEPKWYNLKVDVNEKFTIVNRRQGETNQIIIEPEHKGDITDVTTVHTKETKSFWKRFTVGPQVGVGIGAFNKKVDTYVGFGISFNINK